MSKKRITKAQREAAELVALEKRLLDIYSGALGSAWGDDDFAVADILSRVIPVCRDIWLCDEPGSRNGFAFEPHCIDRYDNPQTAAKFLFEVGCRADQRKRKAP